MTTLVLSSKPKDSKIFKPLAIELFKLVVELLKQDDEEKLSKVTSAIFDICESDPAFVKKLFDELIQLMEKVRAYSTDHDSQLKSEAVECLVFVVERYPSLIKENISRLEKILELIILSMMEIEDEVCDEWKSPPDGFNDDLEEDDDQKIIKVGMDYIDRLILHLGKKIMLAHLSKLVTRLLEQKNWKMRHAALMAVSQIGEYMMDDLKKIESIDNIENILQMWKRASSSPNPRIRYATCHGLGQFADDLQPFFQKIYHQQFFAIILPLIQDPVPRVVAHAFAALTNFLEHAKSDQVAPHFQILYQQTMHWILNGILYVKEACLGNLSALCEGCPILFAQVYDEAMKLILQVFAGSQDAKFKQLRGNAIESATIIAKVCGKERLQKYAVPLIEEMLKIQNSDISKDGHDPQKSYLLAGWQRLCLIIPEVIVNYLDSIVPDMIKITRSSIENDLSVKTYMIEESDIALQMINVFMQFLGSRLSKYLQQIFDLILVVIEHTLSEDIKMTAVACLPGLVKIKGQQENISEIERLNFAKAVIVKLWQIIKEEKDTICISDEIFYLQKVLKCCGAVFTSDEMLNFYKECEQELLKAQKRISQLQDQYDVDEENEKDLKYILKNDRSQENQLKLEIANLFGVLFRTHGQKALPLYQRIHQEHIVQALQDQNNLENIEYGMFLIVDAIEHLGHLISTEVL